MKSALAITIHFHFPLFWEFCLLAPLCTSLGQRQMSTATWHESFIRRRRTCYIALQDAQWTKNFFLPLPKVQFFGRYCCIGPSFTLTILVLWSKDKDEDKISFFAPFFLILECCLIWDKNCKSKRSCYTLYSAAVSSWDEKLWEPIVGN